MGWDIMAIPAAAVGRSLLGWLSNSLEDGKISRIEWVKLGTTIVRVSRINVGLLGVAGVSGANADMISVAMASVGVDMIYSKIEKMSRKK